MSKKLCFSHGFKKNYSSFPKRVYKLKPLPGKNFVIVCLQGGSTRAQCSIHTSQQYSLPDITKDKKAVGNSWGEC